MQQAQISVPRHRVNNPSCVGAHDELIALTRRAVARICVGFREVRLGAGIDKGSAMLTSV